MNKEIRAWLILAALQLIWIIPVAVRPAQEPSEPVHIETETEIIRWKTEEEVSIQPMEIEPVRAPQAVSLGEFKLTAYCPCAECSDKWGYQTSTGAIATEGRTVAVDPTIIPYGTVLIINGQEYVAEDCGAAVKGNVIDIFFNEHKSDFKEYAEVFVKESN